jgi:hypothetical protein
MARKQSKPAVIVTLSDADKSAALTLATYAEGSQGLAKVLMHVIRLAPKGQAVAHLEAVIVEARAQILARQIAKNADKVLARKTIAQILSKARRVAAHVDAHGIDSIGKATSVATAANKMASESAKADKAADTEAEADEAVSEADEADEAVSEADEAAPLSIDDAIAFLADGDADVADALMMVLADETHVQNFVAWVQAGCKAPRARKAA